MALKKCVACDNQVSLDAKTCPQCGAKQKTRTFGPVTIVVMVLFAFGVYQCNSVNDEVKQKIAASQAATEAAAPASAAAVAAPAKKQNWEYQEKKDAMKGTTVRHAIVQAEESLSLDFPYAGSNFPTLHLRKNGNDLDAIFTIEKGQLICGVSGCDVSVKFDDNKAMKFSASGPTDHSSTILFLEPAGKFVQLAKKSKKILVEVTLYQSGNKVVSFQTEGLDWK